MPDGLYEIDALAWGELQASLLGRLAAGERVNEAIDWSNVIEEIRDVGLSELHACESLLTRALGHVLKLWAWPDSLAAGHWRRETKAFLNDARRRFSPSMGRRIDLRELYAEALSEVRSDAEEPVPPRSWPEECPFNLAELVAKDASVAKLVARLPTAG